MSSRPDLDHALAGLKDFQRRSVNYVFRRLYGGADPVDRFLVADEVGLGKTLVARGVIARTIDHLWDATDRIDIIYICSNAAIARQNIRKLRVGADAERTLATRITMLPLQHDNLSGNKVNFISFTPSTSFSLASSLGRSEERVLLHDLLRGPWHFRGAAPINVLQGNATADRFRSAVDCFDGADVDPAIRALFGERLRQDEDTAAAEGRQSLRQRFSDLCVAYPQGRSRPPKATREQRAVLVGELRSLLAATCLRSLEPDLIILDEFQRFKHLLDDQDENSQLARDLFNYADDQSRARVLLLSATPYKMYTAPGDGGTDDHFSDFLATLKFLQKDENRTEATGRLISAIRSSVMSAAVDGGGELARQARALEAELQRVMVRTERLAVSPDRDGMLTVSPERPDVITVGDVHDYLALADLADLTDHHEPIEYWKSAPYLLSFMEKYKFKALFENACADPECVNEVATSLSRARVTLDWDAIERFGALDPANARMRWLLERVVHSGAWRLLWVPPSAPSWPLAEAFAQAGVQGFTKTLIFSSWQVVPRAIASIVSYEVERQIAHSSDDAPRYKRVDSIPLRLERDSASPTLALLYPSFGLARMASDALLESGPNPERAALLARIEQKVAEALEPLREGSQGPVDDGWYWAAPVLVDALIDRVATLAWLEGPELASMWGGAESDDGGGAEGVFGDGIIPRLQAVAEDLGASLGAPPTNLTSVLARIALGSPSVAALRAMTGSIGEVADERDHDARATAGRIGYLFRNLFNLPKWVGIIRGRSIVPYWQLVVEYCMDGCLADVLAEYAHMLLAWRGVDREPKARQLLEVRDTLSISLGLRTAQVGVDEIKPGSRQSTITSAKRHFRTRFASRLAADENEVEHRTERLSRLGKAFNSPFWPFVLASTSIGQEGLDFHLYCHAVAHWNLPSNPVDLEQREGRVHRFKGHAVRKNVALRHAAIPVPAAHDRWQAMFDAAASERDEGAGDLVPFWVYCVDGGARIERHLPTLPLSREAARYHHLRESLAIYRMVFGQPRQEDLVDYLRKHVPEERLAEIREQVRIDLSPPRDA